MTLPPPVNATDMYLAAVLEEIKGLRADLATVPPAPDGLDQLREPETAVSAPDPAPLPDDFPGRAALAAAGIDTFEDLPRTGDGLTAVSGIGTVTANQILTWLATN
jgi:hypothetical protein